MRVASSEPNSFRIEPSGPGGSPRRRRVRPRSRVTCKRLRLDRQLRQLLADMALAPGRLLPVRELLRQFEKPRDLRRVVAPAGAAALEHQRRRRDLPALVERPDEVLLRHDDILEEHLVEMPVAVQQYQRPHRDPRRLHVDQQIGDAVMLRRVRVGAHQQKAPIGEMRARGPHLLAVDQEMVALVDRRGCAGWRGRSRRPARNSPGTRSRRS